MKTVKKALALLLALAMVFTLAVPVFADEAPQTYQKVTSAPDDWCGTYLIVYEADSIIFDGSLGKLDVAHNVKSVTISDGKIVGDYAANSFTIEKFGDSYAIKSASGSYMTGKSGSNTIVTGSSPAENVISISDGVITIDGKGTTLQFNKTNDANNYRFRYYKSNQQPIALYKLVENVPEEKTPAVLSTDIGEKSFVAGGDWVEFTFSTVANDYAGVMVYGGSDFGIAYESKIAALEYKASDQWIDMKGQYFGGNGFALGDATSTFRVKFAADAAGDYCFHAFIKTVDGDEELCSLEVPFTVAKAYEPCVLSTDIGDVEFVAGEAQEFSFTTKANDDMGKLVIGCFDFADFEAVAKIEYYEVRTNEWYELPDASFGPATGFPVSDATSRFRVTFKEAGEYPVTAYIKTLDGTVLGSVEAVFNVAPAPVPVLNPAIEITDCGLWGDAHPNFYNLGWKYTDFDYSTITEIRVGMIDAEGNFMVEYSAKGEQLAWQQANGYITAEGLSSAPFYQIYDGVLLENCDGEDWSVEIIDAEAFAAWQPAKFYVVVETADGESYSAVADYNGPYAEPYVAPVPAIEITDCGLWGEAYPNFYNLGWKYIDFDYSTITEIRVGMIDAEGNFMVEYSADAEQIAWQQANGYITADDLSSAPFYQIYDGVLLENCDGEDWSVEIIDAEAFAAWQPAKFYVVVETADGESYSAVADYNGPYAEPYVAPVPVELTTNINDVEFVACHAQEFTFTTVANDDAGKLVIGYFDFADMDAVAKIEYYETNPAYAGWYELPDASFGPATGFPVSDATSRFRITFKEAGEYPVTAYIKTLDGEILGSVEAVFTVAACEHENAAIQGAVAATCTVAGYTGDLVCPDCGAVVEEGEAIPALGHDYGEWVITTAPTCTEKGEETRCCSRCDATETREVDALGHDYGEWTVTTEPTCTEKGEETRYCSRCDAFETREVEPLGHDYGEWTVTIEPTCTEKGEKIRYCSRCDAFETREVEPLGHDYGEWTVTTEPTCTEKGVETRCCCRCDAFETREVEALGHDYGEWTVTTEPTCTEKGEKIRYCSRCDAFETREVEELGHDYAAVVTAPTCTEQGYTTYTCSRCGDSHKANFVEPLGHDFGEWKVTTKPTCTEKGEETRYCSRCEAFETREVEALGHDYGDWVVTTKPTCTEKGEKIRYCSRCDAFETREVEELGHDYVAVVTAPTCTEKGYTTYTCSHCGDSYVADYVDALGHDFGEWKVTTKPTCTEKGEETRYCSRCDAFETREVEELGHDYVAVVTAPTCTEQGYTTYTCSHCGDSYAADYVDALGHDYIVQVTVPTCTKDGFITKYCMRCDAFETTVIPALGHDYGEWVVTTEPTCTEKGVETHYCSRCDAFETRDVEPLGHNHVAGEVTAPTCTEKGYTTYTCTRCDDSYKADFVDALGHDHVAGAVTAPTCTEKGYTTYTCSRCGDSYKADFVDALGHDFGEWTLTTEPTCDEKGVETRYCSRCDAFETREVDELGHAYVGVVTAPTCTEQGYTTYTCKRCGDSHKADFVDALGHDFGEWVVTTKPTCDEKGVETRYCSRCDAFETREIDELGHDYIPTMTTAPTCTEQGYTTYTCSSCGDTCKKDFVPALGHIETVVGAKTATCMEEGYTGDVYCERCGELVRTGEVIPVDKNNHDDPFTDIKNSGYHDYIIRAHNTGLINGYDDDTFRPNSDVTRGQFITILWRAAGSPSGDVLHLKFSDTYKIPLAYVEAVAWGVDNGIIMGYGDNTFRSNESITRAQMATFMYRYMKNVAGYDFGDVGTVSFADDANIANSYKEAVNAIVSSGIMNGTGNNMFSPNVTANRGMAATVLLRMYNLMNPPKVA